MLEDETGRGEVMANPPLEDETGRGEVMANPRLEDETGQGEVMANPPEPITGASLVATVAEAAPELPEASRAPTAGEPALANPASTSPAITSSASPATSPSMFEPSPASAPQTPVQPGTAVDYVV